MKFLLTLARILSAISSKKSAQFLAGLAIPGAFGVAVFFLFPHGQNSNGPQAERRPAVDRPVRLEEPGVCQDFFRAVCQKRGVTHDPTGAVKPDFEGELKALRLYQEIIRANPDWSSEQVDSELVKKIYTSTRVNRLRHYFKWARDETERLLWLQPDDVLSPKDKKLLLKRLQALELELPPPASKYADEPDLFTQNDVYYERRPDGRTRLRVGGAYLFSVKSRFNMIFTLAHELAHAIDPCELKATASVPLAYLGLTSCFLRGGYIARRASRLECGDNDQVSETFADWMAVQVTSQALKKFSDEFAGPELVAAATNAVRDLCDQEESDFELDQGNHPSPQVRIERIYGNNALIRETLGCGPPNPAWEYCGFTSPKTSNAHPTF